MSSTIAVEKRCSCTHYSKQVTCVEQENLIISKHFWCPTITVILLIRIFVFISISFPTITDCKLAMQTNVILYNRISNLRRKKNPKQMRILAIPKDILLVV